MPWRDTTEAVKPFLASLAFVASGFFLLWADGPRSIAWIMIPFGAFGALAVVYRFFKPLPHATTFSPGGGAVLRDGRDYRVDATDNGFAMSHKTSNKAQRMAWTDITCVSILAIDSWPVGTISFMVHHSSGVSLEIPWDAEGNREFLETMQQKLPGFDNMAVIHASGMVHGFKQVWPAEVPSVTH